MLKIYFNFGFRCIRNSDSRDGIQAIVGACSHLKISEENHVCVPMSMRAFHDGKKILNQLRISLAPSALFLLLITVLFNLANCIELAQLEIWTQGFIIASTDHLYT